MNTFFYSDPHFYHEKIIKYCKRPFANAEEMNEIQIQNWNRSVKYGDYVYVLGDWILGLGEGAVKTPYANMIRARLNGNIIFIMGNHDPESWYVNYMTGREPIGPHFQEFHILLERKICGQTMVLFHYGMRTWHHDLRGVWHLYGHSHSQLPPYGKSMDVGADANNFTPVHFDEVKAKMDSFEIGDHPSFAEFNAEQNADTYLKPPEKV